MSDDDDDPVVDEIPVFLSHELTNKLFIFQYPVQPSSTLSGKYSVVKSQIKPENQEVVLEVGLDTENINYDKSHGEQIAAMVDKDKQASTRTYPSKIMDKLRLDSSRVNVDSNHFAIGAVKGKSLTLSPIRGIVSLTPSFNHANVEEKEKTEEEATLVRVQFARAESEKAKKAREASYNYFFEKTSSEPWYHTKFHELESPLAQLERSRLIYNQNQQRERPMELTGENYLDRLIPIEKEVSDTIPSLPDHVMSISSLKELSDQEQVRRILDQVKVVSALHLSWILGMEMEKIVRSLQTCAVMVLGNWVLRSDLLYKCAHNGIPSQVMANSRDYILHEFHSGKTLERKTLGGVVALPHEDIKEIMAQVAVLKRNKTWQFRLQPDKDFMARYPDVVEQHNLLWKIRSKEIEQHLSFIAPRAQSPRKRNNSESSQANTSSAGQRRRKNSSVSSDGDSSDTGNTSGSKRSYRKRREPKIVIKEERREIKEEPPS